MTVLLRYDAACQALAAAATVDEAKEILNRADAVRVYARQANNETLENDAKIIRWRAIRRVGEMIAAQPKAKGTRGQIQGRDASGGVKITPPEDDTITFEQAGIDKNLAKLARRYASMEETSFERLVARCKAHADQNVRLPLDVLAAEAKAALKSENDRAFAERTAGGCSVDDLYKLIAEGRKFKTILADPPWKFIARSDKGEGRSAGQHYRTDILEAIKALPIAQLADDDAVLLMWMVDWCPMWAMEIIEAWGFAHKTTAFTWAKENPSGEGWHMGQGYWTRSNPEACWLATRGHPKRVNADVRQLIIHPLMEHSRKPDETHDRIERLVAGPYLELYARRERPGWVTWGNEIACSSFASMIEAPTDGAGNTLNADPITGEIQEEAAE